MGRGGDGFSTGGAGASFTSGTFTTPETVIPVGSKFYGTWQQHRLTWATPTRCPTAPTPPRPSTSTATATATACSRPPRRTKSWVVFGDGQGGLLDNGGDFNGAASATVTLKVPGITNPVVAIGDFNGDGRPDIAVASGDPNNTAGIYVFLDQIGTALDPINSRNFTHSLVGDHPFSAAMQSALPTLAAQGFYQTSGAVVALAAGDFNGDGITDIAYIQNVTAEVTFASFQTVAVLLGDAPLTPQNTSQALDATHNHQVYNTATGKLAGSGYFYANAAAPKAPAALLNEIFLPGTDLLQATSLTNANLPNATTGLPAAPEILVFAQQGMQSYNTISLTVDPTTHIPLAGFVATGLGLGQVDTNRTLGSTNISLTNATLQEFTIQDVDQDGSADIVVLTKTPANFLVDFRGDGKDKFVLDSNPNAGGDNSGIALPGNSIDVAITAVDTNTNPAHVGTFDTVGVLSLPTNPAPNVQEFLLQDANGAPTFYTNNGTLPTGRDFSLGTIVQDQTVQGLDAFYATAPTLPTAANPAGANLHPAAGYGVLSPESSTYMDADLFIFAAPGSDPTQVEAFPTFIRYLTANGYVINSGDGGGSTTGVGGAAGSIGGTTNSLGGGTGAVTITFPVSQTYLGEAFLQGGSGGSGFAGGGNGGDVTGVAVRYAVGATLLTSDVQLAAGNGGNGISGDGGNGGSLSLESVQTGVFFGAGNAGSGLHGGQGGSISGNGAGVYDTSTSDVQLTTGNGGEGALAGGQGGNISNWDSQILNFVGTGGLLSYTTGAGGGAAGGTGGAGGSILNSSPDQNQNNLSGSLTLATGAGGGGLSGGAGGAITNFINSATNQSAVPTELTVVTGNGGVGVSGAGGAGGAITSFSSNATGLAPTFDGSLAGIGRIIAGDGGASFGAAGGVGGSIASVTATTTSTPLVVAAGAGGNGLTLGGDGGSVTNSSVNSAALQIGKMLVVAGKGGDAFAAQPIDISLPGDADTTDLAHTILAFGGATGTAGNGGNIMNVTQPVGAQTAVDLIAGNGGNTPNAGTATTATTGVGHGGSVTGVTLTGTVGAISRDTTLGAETNPPIQSYSFTDATGATNTSVSAFVDFLAAAANSNNPLYTASTGFVLDDSVGNVGIVAGAAGTVRGAQPAQDGVNGDVTGITAASIMSIVAGSVDNVAPVRILSGITVTNTDGVLGADKSPDAPFGPNGALDYYNAAGVDVANLAAGYRLIDGAIFASSIEQTAGSLIRGPRVFSPAS